MEKEEFTALTIDETAYVTRATAKFRRRKIYAPKDPKKVLAYIPGVIQKIYVQPGQSVKWGDSLVILEAMKMKNDLTAPLDGVVRNIHVRTGEMVVKNQLLIELE